MANMTAEDASQGSFIPELWLSEGLGYMHANAIMARIVSRDFEDVIAAYGDTVNIPVRGTLAAHEKTPGAGVSLQAPAADKLQIVLDQYYEVSFLVEDVLSSESIQKQYLGYVGDAGKVMSDKVDVNVCGLYADAGVSYGSAAADLQESYFSTMRKRLNLQRVSPTGRVCVVQDYSALLTMDKFADATKVGTTAALREGALGRIYGFDIMEDPNVVETTSSPNTLHNIAFHPDFMYLTTRPLSATNTRGVTMAYMEVDGVGMRLIEGYNMTYLGDQITLDVLWTSDTVRGSIGVIEVLSKP